MFIQKSLLSVLAILLLGVGIQSPAAAQADSLTLEEEDSIELAQSRRRSRRRTTPNFSYIGIGADLGTTDDLTFAVISKVGLAPNVSIRPSALIGDDFAVLVPVTYDFGLTNANSDGFQVRPYVGGGASYISTDDEDDFGLLISGGVDFPVSNNLVINAQANYAGVFSDEENLGATVGVGYVFGR